MYVAVKGGSKAIAAAHALLAEVRRGPKAIPEITRDQIGSQLSLAVDRVQAEGSLYAPALAAAAVKQARGDLVEATFLLRAYRATVKRLGHSVPIETSAMIPRRRISATFKDLPGGQLLGPTFDYTHRLLEAGGNGQEGDEIEGEDSGAEAGGNSDTLSNAASIAPAKSGAGAGNGEGAKSPSGSLANGAFQEAASQEGASQEGASQEEASQERASQQGASRSRKIFSESFINKLAKNFSTKSKEASVVDAKPGAERSGGAPPASFPRSVSGRGFEDCPKGDPLSAESAAISNEASLTESDLTESILSSKSGKPAPEPDSFLESEGLLEEVFQASDPPGDLTRRPLDFPADRRMRLQNLARADEGFLLAMAYSCQRGYGAGHPFVTSLRLGTVEVEIRVPELGIDAVVARMEVTEATTANPIKGGGAEAQTLTRGYGLTLGHNERKALAMAIVDRALRAKELGERLKGPAQDEEFVMYHSDNVEASGFVSHLRLPHHVDFQAELGVLRAMRATWTGGDLAVREKAENLKESANLEEPMRIIEDIPGGARLDASSGAISEGYASPSAQSPSRGSPSPELQGNEFQGPKAAIPEAQNLKAANPKSFGIEEAES